MLTILRTPALHQDHLFEKLILSLISAGTMSSMMLMAILALNRLLTIADFVRVPKVFYIVLLAISLSYIPVFEAFVLFDGDGVMYDEFNMVPGFVSSPMIGTFTTIDTYIGFISFISSLVMYLLLVVLLIIKRLKLATLQKKKLASYEITILVQSIVTFIAGGSLFVLVNYCPASWRLSYHFRACSNWFLIMYAGALNPVMYIVSNGELRRALRAMIFVGKMKKVMVVPSLTPTGSI